MGVEIMMDSEHRPFSTHFMEERMCEYCSEIFIAHHGLQRYCPEKYGKKDDCKAEQKKMVKEQRLAERVIELSHTGMKVYPETQIDRNYQALSKIMGSDLEKTVECTLLDYFGYEICHFNSRTAINEGNNFLIHVGDFTLDRIGQKGTVLTFKITRL